MSVLTTAATTAASTIASAMRAGGAAGGTVCRTELVTKHPPGAVGLSDSVSG